ncbi:MAG: hypothetical protein H6838_09225 [Planctomycetes bacterium]|nr:hypothetical protein [Planctomycetota bacterium]
MKFALALPALFVVAACHSTPAAPCPDTQAVVTKVAAAHGDVLRLTVHAVPPGGGAMCGIASTSPERLGRVSDSEDHRAIDTGEIVVLDEPGAVDYSVPVRQKDGKFTAVVGVTLKSGGDPAALRASAVAIAAEVAGQMK